MERVDHPINSVNHKFLPLLKACNLSLRGRQLLLETAHLGLERGPPRGRCRRLRGFGGRSSGPRRGHGARLLRFCPWSHRRSSMKLIAAMPANLAPPAETITTIGGFVRQRQHGSGCAQSDCVLRHATFRLPAPVIGRLTYPSPANLMTPPRPRGWRKARAASGADRTRNPPTPNSAERRSISNAHLQRKRTSWQ